MQQLLALGRMRLSGRMDRLSFFPDVSAHRLYRNRTRNGEYDKLEDGSFAGEIPKLEGVIAFGNHSENVKTNFAQLWRTGFSSASGAVTNSRCLLVLI
jgi:hypothetical protein